jgi:hypothetical protein
MHVTTQAPENMTLTNQGRQKGEARLAVESLEVGQWLRIGTFTDTSEMAKAMNRTRQTVFLVQKRDASKFTVRKTTTSELWVGRVS